MTDDLTIPFGANPRSPAFSSAEAIRRAKELGISLASAIQDVEAEAAEAARRGKPHGLPGYTAPLTPLQEFVRERSESLAKAQAEALEKGTLWSISGALNPPGEPSFVLVSCGDKDLSKDVERAYPEAYGIIGPIKFIGTKLDAKAAAIKLINTSEIHLRIMD
jgi:hypothetical protein